MGQRSANGAKPVVTDHAIRRFAERVLGVRGLPAGDYDALGVLAEKHGLDIMEIERALAAAAQVGVDHKAGGVVSAGVHYVLNGNSLVTVWSRHKRRRRGKPRIDRDED